MERTKLHSILYALFGTGSLYLTSKGIDLFLQLLEQPIFKPDYTLLTILAALIFYNAFITAYTYTQAIKQWRKKT